MKQWKTVLVSVAIALLVAALVVLTLRVSGSQSERDIKNRISQYKLVKEERQLITDILTLKYEAAVIQSKFQSALPKTRTVIEKKE